MKNVKNESVRNIKSTLFAHAFSEEKALADLYRALGKNIGAKDIEYLDLDKLLQRVNMYNDTAFRTKDNRLIVFIEHQSTINTNMPFRFLEYFVFVIKLLDVLANQDRFANKRLLLPKVEFYVAYNGKTALAEKDSNLLLDLGDIIVKVKVVDIHFDSLPEKSTDNILSGYSYFVKIFEESKRCGSSAYEAFNIAVRASLEAGYLTDILTRKECIDVFMETYCYDDQLKDEGKIEGKIEIYRTELGYSVEEIAKRLGVSVEYVAQVLNGLELAA